MLRGLVQYTLIGFVAFLAFHYLDDFIVYYGEPAYLNTVFGKLKGQIRTVRGGGKVYAFTSIPYGKPPVGDLRYEPPVAYGKWDDVYDATRKIRLCPQFDPLFNKIDGVEDCLQLHVYTPRLNEDGKEKLLPVMIFFHGGHYMYGGNNLYGPDYLLEDEDIVIVTVNYRLNSFGFLNTGDQIITGNQGLKDQNLALKWVQKGIKEFGGNPMRITLFGCSAGGSSATNHMLSPMSKSLFHRVIAQSGTSLSPWGFTRDPVTQAKRLAKKLNCSETPSLELVKCLRGKSVEEILSVHKEIGNVFTEPNSIFGPSIEKSDSEAKTKGTVFLSDSPTKLFKSGQYNSVPLMTGMTSEEGCYRSALILSYEDKLSELNSKWTEVLPKALLLYNDDPNLSAKIKKFYFGNRNSANKASKEKVQQQDTTAIGWNDLESVTNMYSDRYFLRSIKDAAMFNAKHAPTHLYYYTYKPDMGLGYILESMRGRLPNAILELTLFGYAKFMLYRHILNWEINDYGVCHTDDLQNLFNLNPLLTINEGSTHYEFSRKLVKLWISFAKNGKPDNFNGISWTPLQYDKKSNKTVEPLPYLRIGKVAEMIDEPFTKRLKFWEDLNIPQN